MHELVFAPIFYLYGSIPFAFIFTYLVKREVIYEKGTTNVGVANAFGVGGLFAGSLTVIGEISKALVPLAISWYFFEFDLTISLIFVFSALLGTNFPIFLKGKGGMGATIAIWTLLILSPYSLLLLAAIFVLFIKTSKDSYLSAILTYALAPLVLFLVERSVTFALFAVATALLFCLKYNRRRDEFAHWKVLKTE